MNRKGLRLDQAPPLHLPLRFFLTAPLFGVGAGLLLAWKGAELLLTPWSFPTVGLVQLSTLGFLTTVMLGALDQGSRGLVGRTGRSDNRTVDTVAVTKGRHPRPEGRK